MLQQSARNQKSTPSSIASQESKTMTMQYVDDFYFSALLDEDLFPISDEKYAEELQFQEVLTSSVLSRLPHQPVLSRAPSTGPSTSNLKRIRMETGKSSRNICGEKLTSSALSCPPHQSVQSHAPSTRQSTRILKRSRMETGESSRTICGICMEEKSMVEMFRTITCSHVFCSDCISKHVAAKIQENITEVKCPGVNCRGVLEPEICRSIVPKEVFDRWEDALSESAVLASQRFYCPFKDCSALLADDCEETIRESECPNCRRMFCAQCRVSWHSGVSCEEYQRLNEYERGREDLTLMELAKTKKWKRCPRCKYFVEKTQGCLHITCRCGFQFCYGCGLTWSDVHSSCGLN